MGLLITDELMSYSILGFFNLNEVIYTRLIQIFYANVVFHGTYITDKVLNVPVRIYSASIAQANGYECIHNLYRKNWISEARGVTYVSKVLMNGNATGPSTYNKLDDKAKVFQQMLNKSILHKAGAKDCISDMYKFCLFHMMTGTKFNLPNLILQHWLQVMKDQKEQITYVALLNKIIWDQKVYEKFFSLEENERKEITTRDKNR
ncbi:hypothetical protein Fmac_018322 [Flemingia macrophylla]|uniref:Uncharacterized protein n=1 Tax=Flemingia macrophylla TaxID=520843 RepID=A0ABD1M4R3_9FABA